MIVVRAFAWALDSVPIELPGVKAVKETYVLLQATLLPLPETPVQFAVAAHLTIVPSCASQLPVVPPGTEN